MHEGAATAGGSLLFLTIRFFGKAAVITAKICTFAGMCGRVKWIMLAIAVVPLLVLCACGRSGAGSEAARLDRLCAEALAVWERARLDSLADSLAVVAREEGSLPYQAKSEFYKGTYREDEPAASLDSRERHLHNAREAADRLNNDTLLCRIYNSMGIWEMQRRGRYATAQYYFNRSAALARKVCNRDYEIAAETNMSEAMRQLGDTMGFKIDRDIFDYARERRNIPLMVASGLHCAEYLSKTANDTTELYPYLQPSVISGKYPDIRPAAYARFYFNRGNYAEALRWIERTNTEEYVDLVILRARILAALGRYEESNRWIDLAIKGFNSGFSAFGIEKIFDLRASNSLAMGNTEEALRWQKRYSQVSDSLSRQLHTDRLHRYRVEYEVGKKDAQIALQKQRTTFWKYMAGAVVVLLAAAVCFYIFYSRRRNLFYRKLAEHYREKLRAEARKPAPAPPDETAGPADETAHRGSAVSDEKADDIFVKITDAIERRHVYRDPNLTRESFAREVGVNRTYFSEIIKRKTGLSYSQFISEARVKEAARILSDPDDSRTLKEISAAVGFVSMPTFFTAFKSVTGVPPAAFRKAALSE